MCNTLGLGFRGGRGASPPPPLLPPRHVCPHKKKMSPQNFFKIATYTTNAHYKRSSKLKKILWSQFFAIVQNVSSAPPREVCTCSTMFCMLDFSTKSDPHYKPKRKMKRKEYGNVLLTTKHSRCTYYELN